MLIKCGVVNVYVVCVANMCRFVCGVVCDFFLSFYLLSSELWHSESVSVKIECISFFFSFLKIGFYYFFFLFFFFFNFLFC